jgi:hypothetical protein
MWNVRSLCRVGSIKSVVGELEKYKLNVVGVQDRDLGTEFFKHNRNNSSS